MIENNHNRRDFMKGALAGAAAAGVAGLGRGAWAAGKREFKISVDGWSLHKEVFGGKIKQTEIFKVIREEFDIDGFSLVNNMLEVVTWGYTSKIKREADRYDITIPLIMVDSERALGDKDAETRKLAVRDHVKWLEMASDLGCRSIRVNWRGEDRGATENSELAQAFVDRSVGAYQELCDRAAEFDLNVIIENHGGASSQPNLLLQLMKAANRPNFGILPDFGNFPDDVDRYDAVDQFMTYAKAVSAKCYDFGTDGNETKIDFERMIDICVDQHDYHGWIGIEFEGSRLSEREGIKACRDLLIKLRG